MNIFYFLHSYIPPRVAFMIGDIAIYWYGIILALAIILSLFVALRLARYYQIKTDTIWDLTSWLIIGGLIGARLYEIFLELPYYSSQPIEIIKIWNGGLAIHGALIGGLIALLLFIQKYRLSFWNLLAVVLPAVALGQAIGRWGNWFNQELFGRPSLASWSIPIEPANRPFNFEAFTYFHPTFLYESLAMFLVFGLLYFLICKKASAHIIMCAYLISYGLIRFLLEFIKIDTTPIVLGLRWPQIVSLVMLLIGISLFWHNKKRS